MHAGPVSPIIVLLLREVMRGLTTFPTLLMGRIIREMYIGVLRLYVTGVPGIRQSSMNFVEFNSGKTLIL